MTLALNLVQELEGMIDQGLWIAGQRIPTERSLSGRFGAARNTVRRALSLLEDRNRVSRGAGRGTFVRASETATALPAMPRLDELGAGPNALLASLVSSSPADVMEVRVIVEPTVAALAATRATKTQLDHLADVVASAAKAADDEAYEYWDAMFHLGIFEAVRNPLLIGLCRCTNEIRRQAEWQAIQRLSATPARRAAYDRSHGDILKALRQRDGLEARRLMMEHLTTVRSHMLEPGLY